MCKVEGCESADESRKGMCQMHYRRFMNYGSTDKPVAKNKPGPKPDPTKKRSRYAPAKARPKRTHCPQGHAYDEENTYISPEGTRGCRQCRKDRVYATRTPGVGVGGINKAKTHCPKGHEYTEDNTYVRSGGSRACRECARLNMRLQNIKRYGITPEKILEMLDEQEDKCKICDRGFSEVGTPHIDHDHACCDGAWSCGECVRGLLCKTCNSGIGNFEDNIEYLKSAVIYLSA